MDNHASARALQVFKGSQSALSLANVNSLVFLPFQFSFHSNWGGMSLVGVRTPEGYVLGYVPPLATS